MAKNSDTTQPGWQIPKLTKESFDEFCGRVGSVAQEDAAGAIFLWQHMPPTIREFAKTQAKDQPSVDMAFWKSLQKLLYGSMPMLLEAGKSPEPKTTKGAKTG